MRFEFMLASVLIGVALITKRQPSPTKTDLYAYVALFFIALIVEIPFSADVDYSWTVFVDRVVKFAFMSFFIVVFVRSPLALRWFLFALFVAWFKLGQEGLLGQITGSKVWENQGIMRLHGTTGLYAHPNSFSGFGLGTLPFIYYLFPLANRWQKAVLIAMTVFAFNIILNTGSRTGYIGFFFFVAIVFWGSKYKLKWAAGFMALALIVAPTIPDQYVERFKSITGKEKEGNSKVVRLVILQDAATIFMENPLGVGVSAFPAIREKRFGRFQDTHNLYMEVLTNLGIQGFIVWALFIAAIFKNIRRLRRNLEGQVTRLTKHLVSNSPESTAMRLHITDLRLMSAMLSAVSAYLLIRLAVGFFGMDLYEIYWWFSLGIVLAIHNMAQVSERITNGLVGVEGSAIQGGGLPEARRADRGWRIAPSG